MSKPKPILQPCMECSWNSQSQDDCFFWEFGGEIKNEKGYQMAYALVAPAGMPVVTVGLRTEDCIKGFNYLMIRVGALNAYNLKLDPKQTTLIFVEKSDVWTTRGHLRFLKWSGTCEAFSYLTKLMVEETTIESVSDIKDYLKKNLNKDAQSLVPLKPFQKHLFEYAGLKLGAFLNDHEDADTSVLEKFEKEAKFSLPNDYRSFLLETNGGHVKNKVSFQVKGLRKPRYISNFRPFRAGDFEFDNPTAYFAFGDPGLLLIAEDEKDEGVYLGICPTVFGKVFSISEECSFHTLKELPLEERLSKRGVRQLGDSFSEFLDSLSITDEIW